MYVRDLTCKENMQKKSNSCKKRFLLIKRKILYDKKIDIKNICSK